MKYKAWYGIVRHVRAMNLMANNLRVMHVMVWSLMVFNDKACIHVRSRHHLKSHWRTMNIRTIHVRVMQRVTYLRAMNVVVRHVMVMHLR
jgi:hypothetical protein